MTTQTYTITVNYDKSVEDLIKLGKYDWKNNDINSTNFPSTQTGKEKVEVELLGFDEPISSEKAIKYMESIGLRPLNLTELLHLGIKYPDLQRKYLIIALGSTWRHPHGSLGVPCLRRFDLDRYLYLLRFGGDWYPGWRFAAVRMVSSTLKPPVSSKPLDTSDTLTLRDLDKKLDKIIKLLSK